MTITATPRAADELKNEVSQRQEGPSSVRVMVQSQCGCGAAHYAMGFDQPEEGDNQIDINGVTVLVDPESAPLLEGAQIDYVIGQLGEGGFSINSPNGGGCGCGGHH
ncbi:MAG: HesB/IscA family protein [Chloroflexota bacterium]